MHSSKKTIVQTILTFKVKGRTKKLTFNGSITEAQEVVRAKYPYHCCTEGHTRFIHFETAGNYEIVDVLTNSIEHKLESK